MRTARLASFALAFLALAPLAPAQEGSRPKREVVSGRNDDLRAAFVDVAREASRFAVQIEESGRVRGYGVIVDGGYVLTSAQVVSGRTGLTANGPAGRLNVALHAKDDANDLALLRINGQAPAGVAFGDMDDVRIGQLVVVVGIEAEPLSVGVISAKARAVEPTESQGNILMGLFSDGNEGHSRAYPRVLQHDGPTTADVFGAPVVDRQGRLLGISVAAPYRGSSHAVSVDQIATALEAMKAGTSTQAPAPRATPERSTPSTPAAKRPYLGISCAPATDAQRANAAPFALLVKEVQGPSAAVGVRAGDLLVAFEGQPITSMDAFAGAIGAKRPGDVVRIGVVRGGEQLQFQVTLGERP
jgi:S1-C subfamily serine protease